MNETHSKSRTWSKGKNPVIYNAPVFPETQPLIDAKGLAIGSLACLIMSMAGYIVTKESQWLVAGSAISCVFNSIAIIAWRKK